MSRVVLYTAPWAKGTALQEKLAGVVSSRLGQLQVVDAASKEAKAVRLPSLPSLHVWKHGELVGQISGQITEAKLVNLLEKIDVFGEGAFSMTRLRCALREATTGRGDLRSALNQFRQTVEEQMRGGSADPLDIQLVAKGSLHLMLQNESLKHEVREVITQFLNGKCVECLDIALRLYAEEFVSFNIHTLSNEKTWEAQSRRPCRQVLELIMASMGPLNHDVLSARSKLQILLDRRATSPVIPKIVRLRRGGLPRRLLNGKWMWEGPHWSIRNKNQIKTGHSTRMFDKIGA